MKASKLTARGLAYAFRAVGRKIAKAHREAQTPHGKQSVKKLMAHGTATNSIEVDAPKVCGLCILQNRAGQISAFLQVWTGRRDDGLFF